MARSILKLCVALCCMLCVPLTLWAVGGDAASGAGQGDDLKSLSSVWHLAPPPSDASVMFLGQLFGSVGGVLGSVSGQVMGQIFRAMNYGVILMAGSMLSYTTIMSVVNSSQDGQFMGQGKKSAWIVLRTVTGVSMMVPQASGYSFVQIFMMWAVVQGVGLADLAWSRVLDYLEHGGAMYASMTTANLQEMTGGDDGSNPSQAAADPTPLASMTSMFQSTLCLASISKLLKEEADGAAGDPDGGIVNLSSLVGQEHQWGVTLTNDGKVNFGEMDPEKYPELSKICGQYLLNNYDKNIATEHGDPTTGGPHAGTYGDYMGQAVKEAYGEMLPVATLVVSYGPEYGSMSDGDTKSLQQAIAMALVHGVVNYESMTQPLALSEKAVVSQSTQKAFKDARSFGWIMAGSYYFSLSKISNQATHFMSGSYPQVSIGPAGYAREESDAKDVLNHLLGSGGYDHVKQYLSLNPQTFYSHDEIAKQVDATNQNIQKTESAGSHNGVQFGVGNGFALAGAELGMEVGMFLAGGPLPAAIMPVVFGYVDALVAKWFNEFKHAGDPILQVGRVGTYMVQAGQGIWIIVSLIVFITAVGLSIMSSVTGIGTGVLASTEVVLPVVTTIVTALIVNGVVLSVYVPLIPFLVFFFTAIGWMMSVVEAMVAAPLVALGMTHPEGHDLLGKSEQSLMLLLSIFIKPIAMIIGFFASILIVRLGLRFFNLGISQVLSTSGISMTGFFPTIGMMVMYTVTVVAIVNFSFTLVHLLPDKIMRWIGVAPESFDVAGQLAEIKSSLSGGMSKMIEGATQSSMAGAGAANSQVNRNAEKFKKAQKGSAKKGN